MTNLYHLTAFSSNQKTGLMPVSTSNASTCPPSCPLKDNGCYAKTGPLGLHWSKINKGARGVDWQGFLQAIKKIDKGALWRHNQAGDLNGSNNEIDAAALKELVAANKYKRGYTYTHYPMLSANNIDAVKHANDNGFTVNLSADSIQQADKLKAIDSNIPVVVILPMDAPKVQTTKAGNKIVVCPAQTRDKVTCAKCQLCAISDRSYIIGFLAHGTQKKKVNALVSAI